MVKGEQLPPKKQGTVALVGLGIYSFEIALKLARLGFSIYIYERFGSPAQGNTGTFGIRSHEGPHYPRSLATRENCRKNFQRFREAHPDFIVPHIYAHYVLGKTDSDGEPSKVSPATFTAVCHESSSCKQINLNEFGYRNASVGFDIEEPSFYVGETLRSKMVAELGQYSNIHIYYNVTINEIIDGRTLVTQDQHATFDHVINCTGYQSLTPPRESLPFDISIIYQPCLGLLYEDMTPGEKPFSLIYMDGWYPCIMPQVGNKKPNTYVVTHGKYTILGSFPTLVGATSLLHHVYADNTYINEHARPQTEAHLDQLWPAFTARFRYLGYIGKVVAKTDNNTEFRDTICFQDNKGVIHYIPGKITGCMEAADECATLLTRPDLHVDRDGYKYAKGGVIDRSLKEVSTKPENVKRATCHLQPFEEWYRKQKARLASPPVTFMYRAASIDPLQFSSLSTSFQKSKL